eukprot:Clim_evm2s103 gene=Clim_evmTU2s103
MEKSAIKMTIKTAFQKIVGTKHPIVMGGMTGVGVPKIVAAVCNAGGLGTLTALTSGSPDDMRRDIEEVRKLTDKPFAVNLTILPTINPPPYEEYAKGIIDMGVKIVETAGSSPKKWIPLFKQAGLTCIHKCTTVRHSLSAQKLGVDIISLDGFECAGHPGEDDMPNMILAPIAAERLEVPFILSGGIGNGKGLAAALSMGAVGINMGTRFAVTKESPWPDTFKQACIDGSELNTSLIFRTLRNTARVYKNKVAEEVVAIEAKPGPTDFTDLQPLVSGARGREGEKRGDVDYGIWSAGPVIGMINDNPTCQELIDNVIAEAEAIVKKNAAAIEA